MNQHFGRQYRHLGILALLTVGLTLASCSGGETPSETATAPEPSTQTTKPVPADAPAAATATAPNTATSAAPTDPDSTIFVGENFTVTITGFGIDAGYKGCDKQGQCLEIPTASTYKDGSYTWENEGYLYMMHSVVGGDYRLDVRDPQGKAIVDEVVRAKHSSAAEANPAPTDVVEMVGVTLWNLTAGDRGCSVELVDGNDNYFTELGSYDVCEQTDLISRIVRVSLQEMEVMAESCQGDPECSERERVPVIIEIRAEAEGL